MGARGKQGHTASRWPPRRVTTSRRRRSKRRTRPPRTRRRASARLRKGFVRMHIVVMAPVGQVVSHAPGLATVEQRLLLPRAEKRRRPENHACQTALHVRSYRLVGSRLL